MTMLRSTSLNHPNPTLRLLAALTACCALLAGCMPRSVTLNFGPTTTQLHESVVLEDPGAGGGAKVAVIDVTGVIQEDSVGTLIGRGQGKLDLFLASLDKAEKDHRVRAVVLRVNSPGGSVVASDIMYTELRRFRETTGKPIVASFGEIAASGGYYVSLAADEIVAQPSSITGSIGVIMPTINISQGLNRIGIVSRSVTSGPNKDLANPLEPMRDSHYAILQHMVDQMYARFKALVLERRPAFAHSPYVDENTDGRIITGARAVELGLADSLGDVRAAFNRAKALAGIETARMVKYHEDDMAPRTPYAGVSADVPAPNMLNGGDVNLLKLDLPGLGSLGAKPYYLWTAGE